MSSFRSRRASRGALLGGSLLSLSLAASAVAVSATGGAGAASSHETGVTSNSISIGATVPLTGPVSPGYNEVAKAAKAIFAYVNTKHNGINGRKINFTIVDDGYGLGSTSTLTYTKQLVNSTGVFAIVGSLGTPTGDSVAKYLNSVNVPQLFQNSGAKDWNQPNTYKGLFGWQPDYITENKVLGNFIKGKFAGKKIGFIGQDDDFGKDGLIGLQSQVTVTKAVTYDALANVFLGDTSTQVAAMKSAGAQVVVLDTIPAATAKTLSAAAKIGYKPIWVISSVGSDPSTVNGKSTTLPKLLAGAYSFSWMPALASTSAWVTWAKPIVTKAGLPWDGNTFYGVGWAVTFLQAVNAMGNNVTRTNIVNVLESKGSTFATPALVPLAYSATDHQGFRAGEVTQVATSGKVATAITGAFQAGDTGGVSPTSTVNQPIPAFIK